MHSEKTIHQVNVNAQEFFDSNKKTSKVEVFSSNKDDVFMIRTFNQFLRELVRDQAKKTKYEYFLDFDDLSDYYKEIIVHNLVDEDDYQAYHQYLDSPPVFYTKSLLLKYQSESQKLLDEMCAEVFFSDLKEAGGSYQMDRENGELVVNW
jgi:hypothetical protein